MYRVIYFAYTPSRWDLHRVAIHCFFNIRVESPKELIMVISPMRADYSAASLVEKSEIRIQQVGR
jgi:hypothetical protein